MDFTQQDRDKLNALHQAILGVNGQGGLLSRVGRLELCVVILFISLAGAGISIWGLA